MTRLRTWLRYSTVSMISTAVGLAVLGVLVTSTAMSPAWANVIATAVGTVPSFELNRRWVWEKRGARSLGGEVLPFWLLSFAGLAVSTWSVDLAASWAATMGLAGVVRTLAIQAGHVAGFGGLWVMQFFALDKLLFRGGGVSPTTPTVVRGRVRASAP